MSLGFRAEANNNSGVISVAGVDQVVINNAGNVAATTFTGALVGTAATATNLATTTGVAPVYGARAWVTFNGLNNTSNIADAANTNRYIYGSANVTNVLRNSVGSYTIYFTSAMPDINFMVVTGPVRYASSGLGQAFMSLPNLPSSSWALDNITVNTREFSGALTDCYQINLSIIR